MQKDIDQRKVDEEHEWQKLDRQLDRELEATFPASDALKITRRQPDTPSRLNRTARDVFEKTRAPGDKFAE